MIEACKRGEVQLKLAEFQQTCIDSSKCVWGCCRQNSELSGQPGDAFVVPETECKVAGSDKVRARWLQGEVGGSQGALRPASLGSEGLLNVL